MTRGNSLQGEKPSFGPIFCSDRPARGGAIIPQIERYRRKLAPPRKLACFLRGAFLTERDVHPNDVLGWDCWRSNMAAADTFYEVIRRQGITRRSFTQFCSLTAATRLRAEGGHSDG